MAKLDPDNWKSAKDVMDERAAAAKKRKRQEMGDASDSDIVEPERPKAEQEDDNPKAKKRKTEAVPKGTKSESTQSTEEERRQRKKDARAAKRERSKQLKIKAKEKKERQKARKLAEKDGADTQQAPKPKSRGQQDGSRPAAVQNEEETDDGEDDEAEEIEVDGQTMNALNTRLSPDSSSSAASSVVEDAEVFSPQHDSVTSSISSIQPIAEEKPAQKQSQPQQSQASGQDIDDSSMPPPRERLAAAIASFRSQRKADSDSHPKSRAELLDQRRRQEERKKAEKKEQRRREKEETQRKQEEEIARRFSPGGSGSLLGSPRSPVSTPDVETTNFSFGRIAFDDGTNFDPNSATQSSEHKKKGPSDPSTALQAALKKKARLSGLDDDKKERVASQDMWMNARKRAAGEKVRDDTSLLKKALKRNDSQKKKSEKEWEGRKEGIQKSIEMKQKKRTENLAKRRDEKGGKGKKGKQVKRPGFEGSFKGRTGGSKKSKA